MGESSKTETGRRSLLKSVAVGSAGGFLLENGVMGADARKTTADPENESMHFIELNHLISENIDDVAFSHNCGAASYYINESEEQFVMSSYMSDSVRQKILDDGFIILMNKTYKSASDQGSSNQIVVPARETISSVMQTGYRRQTGIEIMRETKYHRPALVVKRDGQEVEIQTGGKKQSIPPGEVLNTEPKSQSHRVKKGRGSIEKRLSHYWTIRNNGELEIYSE